MLRITRQCVLVWLCTTPFQLAQIMLAQVVLAQVVLAQVMLAQVVLAEGQLAQESQPLAVQAERVMQTLAALGAPWPDEVGQPIIAAMQADQTTRLESLLDAQCAATITINPESRVKVEVGQHKPRLQQAGYVPWLFKVINQGRVESGLRVTSPQAGPAYAGVALLSMQRQDQLALRLNEATPDSPHRFLHFEWFEQSPMTRVPSGAAQEYAILLVYSSDAGQREAVLEFSAGPGTSDLGFRAQLPVHFDIPPALPVRMSIRDQRGDSAFAKLTIRDQAGHIYPPQPRRLAPDFFFQPQIYREDGELVYLPPGQFTVDSSQGPETIQQSQPLHVQTHVNNECAVQIKSWVKPLEYGWASGDHHIHGAGCAHYTSPTEGVTPADMFRQVAGEGLNVGCVLTWGPCFEHQRHFFRPEIDAVSRPRTLLKYDIEISGFGSQALGHVCLLNLRDQYYPGSEGTKEKGWPTWATPALQWAKSQGAVTGFAHSASGLEIDPARAAERLLTQFDADHSQQLSPGEAADALLPESFTSIDTDRDRGLSRVELEVAIDRVADQLPNLAIPEMNSVGAMELPVAVTFGACDFISTMDTARIAEWNMWYHILNCGYPLKASGETDFPCMSGNCVGQGRVYVALQNTDTIDFTDWCNGIAAGRSYVSDGYAHALRMAIATDKQSTSLNSYADKRVHLSQPGPVKVTAQVAIAPRMPVSVAYATRSTEGGQRIIGDTVTLHGSRNQEWVDTKSRNVEIVVNGKVVAQRTLVADGSVQPLEFDVAIDQSSWIALRIFPHLHTNPLEVWVGDRPIRASSDSARWCVAAIEQLWRVRQKNIAPQERMAAEAAFQQAIAQYQQRITN